MRGLLLAEEMLLIFHLALACGNFCGMLTSVIYGQILFDTIGSKLGAASVHLPVLPRVSSHGLVVCVCVCVSYTDTCHMLDRPRRLFGFRARKHN